MCPSETAPGRKIHVFTIAPGLHFARTLARGMDVRFAGHALADTEIYLPTRRAVRSFTDIFARVAGGATLLPSFKPLGTVAEEDEDALSLDEISEAPELPPAISGLRRRMLLAALVRRWDQNQHGGTMSFTQAVGLAKSLGTVMDEVEIAGADISHLEDLAPENLASHWAEVKDFLQLIHTAWPGILEAEGCINPMERRNLALAARAEQLSRNPPDHPIIAAGSTGSIPATAMLMKAISRLPLGAIVLPGLDKVLDQESWDRLDPGHPQFGLKLLLERLEVSREDVEDWLPGAEDSARNQLIRETLRPAPTTDAWRALAEHDDGTMARGLKGLSLFEASDPTEEAAAIALMLRETLETPGRTAALITRDRSLGRRVAVELRRWKITVADTGGRPLAQTQPGIFLSLLAEAAESHFAPVPLMAFLKHPLTAIGERTEWLGRVRLLDKALRGPRPDGGLNGILARITQNAREAAARGRAADCAALEDLEKWFEAVTAAFTPIEEAYQQPELPLGELLSAHIAAAENFCPPDTLWAGAAGNTAFSYIQRLATAAEGVPAMEPSAYASLMRSLMLEVPVVTAIVGHPRLFILGPLEARQQNFDRTILGGLNEGTWPIAAHTDPWFSRPMRTTLGLEQPERVIGLSAHDFSNLAAGDDTILTRSLKADGTPTVASRWLARLSQLTEGLGVREALTPPLPYGEIVRAMHDPGPATPMAPPAPCPPVAARPRRLTVTEIETWLRDPYAIYAKHVLGLRRLDPLDDEIGPPERGTILHAALERFTRKYPHAIPENALPELVNIIDNLFTEQQTPKAVQALWRPRFLRAARWFIHQDRPRRRTIAESYVEISGSVIYDAPAGPFMLAGKADRIDRLKSGKGEILDYKTGNPPSDKQVVAQLSPQLPLEAVMLKKGGFKEIGELDTETLSYIKISGGNPPGIWHTVKADAEALAADAEKRLKGRIEKFDNPDTSYDARVAPQFAKMTGDYDHLARVKEWSMSGWGKDD